jgi:hypothetical protein
VWERERRRGMERKRRKRKTTETKVGGGRKRKKTKTKTQASFRFNCSGVELDILVFSKYFYIFSYKARMENHFSKQFYLNHILNSHLHVDDSQIFSIVDSLI